MRDQAEPFLLEQINKLEAERDELRAALERLLNPGFSGRHLAEQKARALLAKYERKK
jgi:hypothetical protein